MTIAELSRLLLENFPYEPTEGQSEFLKMAAAFLLDREERNLLVLKGYAGTGKTSVVRSIVNVLEKYEHGYVLLAPTGRSAKVLSKYSQRPAFTIHKRIYRLRAGADGMMHLFPVQNFHKNTLFIVDEASMIQGDAVSDPSGFGTGRSLLDDLMDFVFNGNNCKLMLIGDGAQLPPVGMDISPALDMKFLKSTFGIKIRTFELTEVVRQESDSGILENAVIIRKSLADSNGKKILFPKLKAFPDVAFIDGAGLEDALQQAYSEYGEKETIVICRSNKRANVFNAQIRNRILGRDGEVTGGDMLMAVKNNYFWLPENSSAAFIANGEMLDVQRLKSVQELYGFRFAEATVRLVDYADEPTIDVLLLLDTIESESPALKNEESRRLYEGILEDYQEIPEKRKRMIKVKEDKYYNALQVKFAYAVTCHKSQGGQWKAVFVDFGYISEKNSDVEFLRWLYTAATRATEKLFLINAPPVLTGDIR